MIRMQDKTWWLWIVFGWALVLFFAYGPRLEPKLFPVLSSIQIVKMEPTYIPEIRGTDKTGTRMFVRFEKYRNCEYLGMNWEKLLPDGTRDRVYLQTKNDGDSGSTRPSGKHIAGPWLVGMRPNAILDQSAATIAYRCHPLWLSPMVVYP